MFTTDDAAKTRIKPVRQQQKRIARVELEGGVSFSLTEASLPLQIGREIDCDISIPSGLISRHHCELFLANGVLSLRDSSSNGTVVAGRNIKGGSVVIERETTVLVAGETRLVITPIDELEPVKNRRKVPERREMERRSADRRQDDILVPFDQRKSARRDLERRNNDRRNDERR